LPFRQCNCGKQPTPIGQEDDPEGALATICFDQEKVMTYCARDRKIVRSVCEEFPIGPWFVSIAIETSRNSRQG